MDFQDNSGPPSAAVPPTALPPPPDEAPPPPPDEAPRSSSLITLSRIVVVLAAVLALLQARADPETAGDSAAILGSATGAAVFPLIVGAVVRRFASHKAGTIAVLVVAGLFAVSSIVMTTEADRQNRDAIAQLEAARATAGIPESSAGYEPSRAEVRCVEERVAASDVAAAFNDTSQAGSDVQMEVLDALLICAPDVIRNAEWLEGTRAGFSAGLGTEVSTGETTCILEWILGHTDRPGLALAGGDPTVSLDAMANCLSSDNFAVLSGMPGAGPQSYGDDEVADVLHDECTAGSDAACDLLLAMATPDSDYFEVAVTCGGRGARSDLYCAPGLTDGDLDGLIDEDSSGLDALVLECRDGAMLACDFIFLNAPFGSEAARIGETCGERRALAANLCRQRYGTVTSD